MSVERVDTIRDRRVESIVVPENEAPAPEVIAARIDLGNAEYHDSCCPFDLWQNDESLFTEMPACDCGGPALAEAYVEQAERLLQVEAERDALREQRDFLSEALVAAASTDRVLCASCRYAIGSLGCNEWHDTHPNEPPASPDLLGLASPAADSGTPPAKEDA